MNDDTIDFIGTGSAGSHQDSCVTTTWSSRVASKPKGRRTYGRRGSVDFTGGGGSVKRPTMRMPRRSSTGGAEGLRRSSTFPSPSPIFENEGSVLEEEKEWGRMTGNIHNDDHDDDNPDPPFMTPPVPGRRKFVRAHSVTGSSLEIPKPPMLKRSQSVSTTMSPTDASSGSFRSSSVSSSMASLGGPTGGQGLDFENLNPNFLTNDFDPLDEQASPKRGFTNADAHGRGRKKSRPGYSASASSKKPKGLNEIPPFMSTSFSNLARDHDELGSTWAGTPTTTSSNNKNGLQRGVSLPTFPDITTDDVEEDETVCGSSPTTMSASSSRKREYLESPISDRDCDDIFANTMQNSRSSLFSPQSVDSKFQIMDVSFQSISKHRSDRMKMNSTLSDDDANMSDSDDESMSTGSEDGDKMGAIPTGIYQPPKVTPAKFLHPDKATVNDVIKSMSSYDDLRFLVASIEKDRHMGSNSWNSAPPTYWNSTRREKFFKWTTQTLGFTFRSWGGGVSTVQISKTRGPKLLDLLKSTIKACKEQGLGNNSPTVGQSIPKEFIFSPEGKPARLPTSVVTKSLKMTPSNE